VALLLALFPVFAFHFRSDSSLLRLVYIVNSVMRFFLSVSFPTTLEFRFSLFPQSELPLLGLLVLFALPLYFAVFRFLRTMYILERFICYPLHPFFLGLSIPPCLMISRETEFLNPPFAAPSLGQPKEGTFPTSPVLFYPFKYPPSAFPPPPHQQTCRSLWCDPPPQTFETHSRSAPPLRPEQSQNPDDRRSYSFPPSLKGEVHA